MSALFDPKHRSWLIWGILAAALAAVVAILNLPWCDEVAYLDPGARLALFGSFTSTAWITNSPETFWASSNPGMPLLFAGWFKVFGFGLLQARLEIAKPVAQSSQGECLLRLLSYKQ